MRRLLDLLIVALIACGIMLISGLIFYYLLLQDENPEVDFSVLTKALLTTKVDLAQTKADIRRVNSLDNQNVEENLSSKEKSSNILQHFIDIEKRDREASPRQPAREIDDTDNQVTTVVSPIIPSSVTSQATLALKDKNETVPDMNQTSLQKSIKVADVTLPIEPEALNSSKESSIDNLPPQVTSPKLSVVGSPHMEERNQSSVALSSLSNTTTEKNATLQDMKPPKQVASNSTNEHKVQKDVIKVATPEENIEVNKSIAQTSVSSVKATDKESKQTPKQLVNLSKPTLPYKNSIVYKPKMYQEKSQSKTEVLIEEIEQLVREVEIPINLSSAE
jgi:hypothetical protein